MGKKHGFLPSLFLLKEQWCSKPSLFSTKNFQGIILCNLGNCLNSQVKEKIIRRLIWIHPSLLPLKDVDYRVLLLLHLAWLLQWPNSLHFRLSLFIGEVGGLSCWIRACSTCGMLSTTELGANKMTLACTREQIALLWSQRCHWFYLQYMVKYLSMVSERLTEGCHRAVFVTNSDIYLLIG